MEQRTCNIIMCCKGHCRLEGATGDPFGDIAAYMSQECGCEKEIYQGKLLENILRTALFDYMNSANNPGYELRQLLQNYALWEPSLSERICTMFALVNVRDDNGYVNGFTQELLDKSEQILQRGKL
ncbi:MAG: hypothetical protein HFF08_03880 [Oscillospiraceae bacterium]|nr:hypothetical protein [Oscillospiraceae bacterium]